MGEGLSRPTGTLPRVPEIPAKLVEKTSQGQFRPFSLSEVMRCHRNLASPCPTVAWVPGSLYVGAPVGQGPAAGLRWFQPHVRSGSSTAGGRPLGGGAQPRSLRDAGGRSDWLRAGHAGALIGSGLSHVTDPAHSPRWGGFLVWMGLPDVGRGMPGVQPNNNDQHSSLSHR